MAKKDEGVAMDALVQRVLDVHDNSTSSKKKRRRRRKKSKSKDKLAKSPKIPNNECNKSSRNGLGVGLFGPLSFVSLQETEFNALDAENEAISANKSKANSDLIDSSHVEQEEELEETFDRLRGSTNNNEKNEERIVASNDGSVDKNQSEEKKTNSNKSSVFSDTNKVRGTEDDFQAELDEDNESESESAKERHEDNSHVRVEMFSDESGISSIRSESNQVMDQMLENIETNNNVEKSNAKNENDKDTEAEEDKEEEGSVSSNINGNNELQSLETSREKTNECQASCSKKSPSKKKKSSRKRVYSSQSISDEVEVRAQAKKSKKSKLSDLSSQKEDRLVKDDEGKDISTGTQDGKKNTTSITNNNDPNKAQWKETSVKKTTEKLGSLSKKKIRKSAKSLRKKGTTSSNSDEVETQPKKAQKAKLPAPSKNVKDAPVVNDDSESADLFKRKRHFSSLSPLRRLLIELDSQIDSSSIGMILHEMASKFEMDVETCLQSLPKRHCVEATSEELSGIIGFPKIRDKTNFPIGTKLTNWFKKNDFGVTRLAETTLQHQPFRHLRKSFRLELETQFEDFKSGRFKQEEEIILLHNLQNLLNSTKVTIAARVIFDELEGEKRRRRKDQTLTLKLWLACYVGESMLHYRRPYDIYCQMRKLVYLGGAKSTANDVDSVESLRVLNAIKKGQMSYYEAKKRHSWINTLAPTIRTVDDIISGVEKKNALKATTRSSTKKGHKSPERDTDEVVEDIIRSVILNIGWSAFSSCKFDRVSWREVDDSLDLTSHRARRLFRRNIQPVLQTHFAGEDICDMSWQDELLRRIVSSTSIKTRLDVDWKELLVDFPLQTTQSLIQFVENQYYTVIRRIEREEEDLTKEQMWSRSHRFKEALEKAYEKRMRRRESSVALAELSVQLAIKRAEQIVAVVEECEKEHANNVEKE